LEKSYIQIKEYPDGTYKANYKGNLQKAFFPNDIASKDIASVGTDKVALLA
jgi:hypothetical protein